MKLKTLYREVVRKGIKADPRGEKAIEAALKERKKLYEKLTEKEQRFFDEESLVNPFSDTRIVAGKEDAAIRSVIVGIDVTGEEILLVERLKEKGIPIDLIIGHHPLGKAYANFYEVMDLQIDVFAQKGVNVGLAEGLLQERKAQVGRRISAANHQKPVDIANWLKVNLMCVHTAADNLACRFVETELKNRKPRRLSQIIDVLLDIPEYAHAAHYNNPPQIFVGSKDSRVSNIHIEFTGGTEGPQNIYKQLSAAGIDTIVAMHQSEEHYRQCKEAHINVVVASHIASDTIGMNCMLDHILTKEKIKIYEFSGFNRFSHTKKKR